MNAAVGLVLAALTIWDYPARQPQHERLSREFISAVRTGDTKKMLGTCKDGVELLPDDPTWHYNLACSLAWLKDPEPALDELEVAIDLGFRRPEVIAEDRDLKRLAKHPRFKELVAYAEEMQRKPILTGPLATLPMEGAFGESVALGSQNLNWDFDNGCFVALLKLTGEKKGGNAGDLYMNRDERHSMLAVTNWPGLTSVSLDGEGRARKFDVDFPNIAFPYPVFGNASRGLRGTPYWRSLPRALMTGQSAYLKTMLHFYTSNQVWVFPSVDDYDLTSTNGYGDVFLSVTPYWLCSQGISWSDQYYLKAALEASRSFQPATKQSIVARGLLAPTIQTLIRKSLKGVKGEDDYLTAKAHPTCLPPNGLDLAKLKKMAAALKPLEAPPLARLAAVQSAPVLEPAKGLPEITYATPFAWAWILRSPDNYRSFMIQAQPMGAVEYAFAVVHDENGAAKLERLRGDVAKVSIDKSKLTTTNRVDVAVFAKAPGTAWGAPSYVSFAVVDPTARYSDPVLTPPEEPVAE